MGPGGSTVSRALNLFVMAIVLATIGGAVLVLMALESEALVVNRDRLDAEDIRELAAVARRTDAQQGRTKTISLSPDRLDAMVDYAASRAGAAARIIGAEEVVVLQVSIPMREGFGFANFHIELLETSGIPDIVKAQVGPLDIPPSMADWVLKRGLKELHFIGKLLHADFDPRQTTLTFRLAPNVDSTAAALIGNAEVRRIQVRYAQLRSIFNARPKGSLEFADVLSELIAKPTGVPDEHGMPDPVGDIRTAFTVLGAYLGGKPLPIAGTGDPLPGRNIILYDRADLPRHFSISAALSAKGGSKLANTTGVAKELYDADGGSGFSFVDILANRSGIRFSEFATDSTRNATYVRLKARRGFHEGDLVPPPEGLQEGLQRGVLEEKIGSVTGAEYARVIDEIDLRISRLSMYR
jgi:hypothetical protein